jgi:hypothetical protein
MQRLLNFYSWSADALRDDLRDYVTAAIGDPGGVLIAWVTADEVYGQHTGLRQWLDDRRVSYVLAVPRSFTAPAAAGKIRADKLAARVPAAGWQQLSYGDGAKGPGTTTGP